MKTVVYTNKYENHKHMFKNVLNIKNFYSRTFFKGASLLSCNIPIIESFEMPTDCHQHLFCIIKNHCVKSFRIRSCSSPYFPAFGLNTKRYSVSRCIESKCRKMRTRKSTSTYTLYAVYMKILFIKLLIVFPHNLLRKYFHLKALFKVCGQL